MFRVNPRRRFDWLSGNAASSNLLSKGAVALRRVQSFHLLPGANAGSHRGLWIGGHEIAEEVEVSADRCSPVRCLGAIETYVLLYEIAIRNTRAARQLCFTPAIQPISRAGSAPERRIEPSSFSLEERLGLAIVRVEDDAPIECEPAID